MVRLGLTRLTTLQLCLLLWGCPSDPVETPGAPDAGPAAWVPGAVAEPFEPQRIEPNWRVAYTTERNARMDRRMFRGPEELPPLGLDRSVQLSWALSESDENGSFARQYNGWI